MTVVDDYYSKIYESQKQKSQDFLKVLGILIGFTLLFFFLILLPYVSLQKTEVAASKALENVTQQIKENEGQINHYVGIQKSIENLKKEINNGPKILREYIKNLSESKPTEFQTMQQELPQAQIFSKCQNLNSSSPEYVRCNVNEKAANLIMGYNATIFKHIIGPLNSQMNTSQLFNLTSLKQKTQSLIDNFKKISLSLDLTRSVAMKELAATEQNTELDKYWDGFGSVIVREVNRINSTLDTLRENKTFLGSEKQQVVSAKSNISNRLDEIQFPLGKIPVGINEANSLFPFGIMAGFIVCTILLTRSLILRKEYHVVYVRGNQNEKTERTGTMIKNELPLWIDPLGHWYFQIIKSAVIVIPFIIFIISWSLILESWSMNQNTLTESILFTDIKTNHKIIAIGYFIVLGLFIVCFIAIAIVWGNYAGLYVSKRKEYNNKEY